MLFDFSSSRSPSLARYSLGRILAVIADAKSGNHSLFRYLQEEADRMDEIFSTTVSEAVKPAAGAINRTVIGSLNWCPEGDLNPHGLAACGF
jgi:hypothetical protein